MEKNKQIQEYLDLCEEVFTKLKKANSFEVKETEVEIRSKEEVDLIQKYLTEKDNLLYKVLVALFKNNSVVIKEKLSLRNGEFRQYRGQYKINLNDVKKIINEYCAYLDLNENELDVLELCLGFVTDEDYESWRGLRDITEIWKDKEYKLPKEITIFQTDDEEDNNFITIEKISINAKGNVAFNSKYRYSSSLNDKNEKRLICYFKEEIGELKKQYNNEMRESRERLEKEIKTIKEQCGKYLLVASLGSN